MDYIIFIIHIFIYIFNCTFPLHQFLLSNRRWRYQFFFFGNVSTFKQIFSNIVLINTQARTIIIVWFNIYMITIFKINYSFLTDLILPNTDPQL